MDDKSNIQIISHILIRDPDSGETILKKRDVQKNEEKQDDRKN